MANITQRFGFQTRYFDQYAKKDRGELIIIGQGTWMPHNMEPEWFSIDNDIWETVFSFDIESITWEGIDITKLYDNKEILCDTLLDVIEKATYSHLEWVFKAEIAEHFGREIEYEADYSKDEESHLEFPTAEELNKAFEVIRNNSRKRAA